MNTGERLRHFRKKKGITQIELARKLGVPVDTVRRWEQNRSAPKIGDELERVCFALNITAAHIVTENGKELHAHCHYNYVFVPIVHYATTAGKKGTAKITEEVVDTFPVNMSIVELPEDPSLKITIIKDNSMLPKYRPGDFVLFMAADSYEDGDVITLIYKNNFYIRGFFKTEGGKIELKPMSHDYATIETSFEDSSFKPLGKVIRIFRAFGNTRFYE